VVVIHIPCKWSQLITRSGALTDIRARTTNLSYFSPSILLGRSDGTLWRWRHLMYYIIGFGILHS
jgi:hypothetical protein